MAKTPMDFKALGRSLVEKLVVLEVVLEIPAVPPKVFGSMFLRPGTVGTEVPTPLNEGEVAGNKLFI